MKKPDKQLKQWVDNWKRRGKILEKLRIDEMRKSNTYESMVALTDAFNSAIAAFETPPTSGLVEQQKWFMLLRKNTSLK